MRTVLRDLKFNKSISCVLLIVIFPYFESHCNELFFIHGRPRADKPNMQPYPTMIYKYNDSSNKLEQVWNIPENVKVLDIHVYHTSKIAIIAEGDWTYKKLCFIPTDSIAKSIVLDLSEYNSVTKYKYYDTPKGMGSIKIRSRDDSVEKLRSYKYTNLSISDNGKFINNKSLSEGELRLGGSLPPYSLGESDIISINLTSDGLLVPIDNEITFDCSPVPDSIIRMKTS